MNMSNTKEKTIEMNNTVKFNESKSTSQREKYLTAKYPQQQMQSIRKRLKVEFWLDDQLKLLYNIQDDDHHHQYPEDLIDSILELNNDLERRQFLLGKLTNVKQSRGVLMGFIEELISRMKML